MIAFDGFFDEAPREGGTEVMVMVWDYDSRF
jgi:hypothetical protein